MDRENDPEDGGGFLRIGQLSEATGVEPSLLRAWESRYGVPEPDRTGGGQRRYPEREVERVRAMKRLTEAGYRASEAARMVTRTLMRTASEERAPAFSLAREDVAALLTQGDPEAMRVLDRAALAMPLEDVIEDLLAPIMREVGERWANGDITVAEEHAATWLATSWVGSQARNMAPPLRSGLIITASPRGERHELGLAMLGIFLRRQGSPVLHLGSDVPAADVARMTVERNGALVCLSVSTDLAAGGLVETIAAVQDAAPEVRIAVGGAWAKLGSLPEGVVLLEDGFSRAAAQILSLL